MTCLICMCSVASYTVLWWDAWVLPSWSANLAWELYQWEYQTVTGGVCFLNGSTAHSGGVPAPPHPQELPSAQQWAVPGQVLRIPLEQRPPPQEQQQQQQPPPQQTQPEAAPSQPAPGLQATPLPLGGLNISADQLQALLASVSQVRHPIYKLYPVCIPLAIPQHAHRCTTPLLC